jgi:hypothetical protein
LRRNCDLNTATFARPAMHERSSRTRRARLERRPVARAELDVVARASPAAARAGPEGRAPFDTGAQHAAPAITRRLADALFLLRIGGEIFFFAEGLAGAAVLVRTPRTIFRRVEGETVAAAPAHLIHTAAARRTAGPWRLAACGPAALATVAARAAVLADAPVGSGVLLHRDRGRLPRCLGLAIGSRTARCRRRRSRRSTSEDQTCDQPAHFAGDYTQAKAWVHVTQSCASQHRLHSDWPA